MRGLMCSKVGAARFELATSCSQFRVVPIRSSTVRRVLIGTACVGSVLSQHECRTSAWLVDTEVETGWLLIEPTRPYRSNLPNSIGAEPTDAPSNRCLVNATPQVKFRTSGVDDCALVVQSLDSQRGARPTSEKQRCVGRRVAFECMNMDGHCEMIARGRFDTFILCPDCRAKLCDTGRAATIDRYRNGISTRWTPFNRTLVRCPYEGKVCWADIFLSAARRERKKRNARGKSERRRAGHRCQSIS